MDPTLSYIHGALIHAAPDNNQGATVERQHQGAIEARMILTVESDYATPLLESMKSDFLSAPHIDAAFAEQLVRLAAPPFAAGGAAVITQGNAAFAASAGNGRCFVERAASLGVVEPGIHTLLVGDRWLVTTGVAPEENTPFFADSGVAPNAAFSNDTLDDALELALRSHSGPVATATTWVVQSPNNAP